ncbi:hypothetical protein CNBF4100 [Cryptococcus deneoformans B-3501A]|uniref:hypothetical protein n=1 Tax=Cryptococcus deneoformans (strain B-3501A) TaxID=283643 RepID=UPI000042C633|nr:hypothetical protein CNBF4100 [Cryptococcus neoformans var. neoformans B-3501A]EAL20084.1 hypothetical protein CNBF4100 [Cryptococcus neoformans var. neoformans B-3501A]
MLDRFDKVWSRLVDFTMTRDVSLAAERVVMHLRRSGIELCHLVGREMGKERVSQPWDYAKEDGKEEVKVDIPDKREEVPRQVVMNRLAKVVESVGGCTLPRPEFDMRVQRVAEEIKMFDERGYQFRIEKVSRQMTKRKTYPLVRLAVMVMKGREKVRTPGAVMLIELGEKKGLARSHVKDFAVFYEGEWPVCH